MTGPLIPIGDVISAHALGIAKQPSLGRDAFMHVDGGAMAFADAMRSKGEDKKMLTDDALPKPLPSHLRWALEPKAREQIERMLEEIKSESRPCKRCGRMLYFVRSERTGYVVAYTDDAVSHFADCPDSPQR